jgi:hypothetical protein
MRSEGAIVLKSRFNSSFLNTNKQNKSKMKYYDTNDFFDSSPYWANWANSPVVSLSAEFALAVLLVTDGELLLLLLFDVGLSVPGDTVSALSNSMFEDSGALVETSIVLERLAIDSTFFAVG